MLLSCSRAEERSKETCLVAVAKGRAVECFVVHDNGNRVEHVADWHLDGIVIALCVAPVQGKGFLVTSASDLGVGWSWIESGSWTIVGTFFQEIVTSTNGSGAGTSAGGGVGELAHTTPAPANTTTGGSEESKSNTLPPLNFVNDPPQGSISSLSYAGVCVLSVGSLLYLTCAASRFGQPMYLVTALCFATELGFGGTAKGTLPYIQMQLEQESGRTGAFASASTNVSASFSGGSSTGVGIGGAANGLGATVNRGENDRTIVIVRQEAVSELDCTLVMQCHHLHMGYNSLRFCELELDGLPDDVDADIMGVHVHGHGGHAYLQAKTTAGSDGLPQLKPKAPAGEGGILRVIWEIVLPAGACWCTEPYNNDGLDSRKLLYLMLPSTVIQVYNVNGLVCECVPPAPMAGVTGVTLHGTPVGISVARLPLTNENRRSLLVSTSTGCYLSIHLDNVQCHDNDNDQNDQPPPLRPYVWDVIRVKSLVEQPYNGQQLASVAHLADIPVLPCSQLMYILSPPEEEDALVLQSTYITILAYHRSFGMQLLSAEVENNGMHISSNKQKEGIKAQDPLQFFSAMDCHAATALARLAGVRRVATTRYSLYNGNIPDRLLAVCSAGFQGVGTSVVPPLADTRIESKERKTNIGPHEAARKMNPSIGSVLYSCEYGSAIETHAEVEVDISANLLGGIALLGLSHAAVYGKPAAVNWDTAEDADEEVEETTPSRLWPLLLSSRVLDQTGVVAVDMARNEVCAEVPFYFRVCADLPTVALLPLGGDGTTHSGLAAQVVNDRILIVYLEEKPQILKRFKIPIMREVSLELLGLTEAVEPLPPLEGSDDESEEDQHDELDGYSSNESRAGDDIDSDLSSDSDSDGGGPEQSEPIEGDGREQREDADEDLTIRSADNSFTRESKRNKQAQKDLILRAQTRKVQREARHAKLLEHETAKLERERSRATRRQARQAQRDKTELKSFPWKIELAGALGNCLALAGTAQLVVVQLVQRDISRGKMKMFSAAPTTPVGKPAPGRRAGTLMAPSVTMEQVPLILRCKQALPANIAAMGTLHYQGQDLIAVGYWGMREVHVWCTPPLPDPEGDEDDPPVQGLVLATTIFLPAISSSNSADTTSSSGARGDSLVRNIVLMPLDISENLTTEDLMMDGWRAFSPANNSGPANKAGKLRNTVESAQKKNGGSYITPITSVMALLVTTVDGSILIYYIYMRQNKDFSVQGWRAVLYQRFRSPQRIINVSAVDTRPCNMCTDSVSPAANHGQPKSKPNIAWDTTPNGAAALLHTADGQYLLHFSAGLRAENAVKKTLTTADKSNNNTAKNNQVPSDAVADGSTVMDLSIGCLHEHEEMAVNNSFSSAFKEYGTIKVVASDEPEKPVPLTKRAKHLQRALALRISLMTPAEQKEANVAKPPRSTKLARQHWLPRSVRGHVWTWLRLLPAGDKPSRGSLVQVPGSGAGGGYRHEGYNPRRQLLASLGFAWVAATDSAHSDFSQTESVESVTMLYLGAPQTSEPRFHPQRRIHVPGSVIDMHVSSDVSKVVIGWNQANSEEKMACMQGVLVVDSQSLKCLWRTSYPYWPPAELKESAAKRLRVPPVPLVPVAPDPSAPRQLPATALAATISMRQAQARLLKKEEQDKQVLDAAVVTALRSLNELASFTTSANGHRTLHSVLAGLPPVLADGSVGTRLQHLSDTVTLLHDMTVSLAVPAPMPAEIPCSLISVYAFTPSKSSAGKQKQAEDAQFVLRVLGSYAYAGSGRVVSTVVSLAALAKENVDDERMQRNKGNAPRVCEQLPRYLLLACDNNISIVGWSAEEADRVPEVPVASELSPPPANPSEDTPANMKIRLTCLQSLTRTKSSALEVQVGARSSVAACKVFVSCTNGGTCSHVNGTAATARAASTSVVSIEIFSFACDPVVGPILRPERVVQIPGGVPSFLGLSAFGYPGKRSVGMRQTGVHSVPERSFLISFVDQTYSDMSTICFKIPEQVSRGSARDEEDPAKAEMSPAEVARSRAYTAIIEREALLLMKHHISFAESEVNIYRQGLPEGLRPTQLLLNCPVNVATRVGRKDAEGRVLRNVSTLWALLDTNLEYHVREN